VTSPGRLGNNPEFQALQSQVQMILRRLHIQQGQVNAASGTLSTKRFRLGAFTTSSLITLGGQVTGSVTWSTPMPSEVYNIDVAVALNNMASPVATITNQAATGCTVSFTAPVAIGLGVTVIVFGVAPATS
jgi:hypothetical protein